jgi:uncharacterized repeat protein (TIGR01451 family)
MTLALRSRPRALVLAVVLVLVAAAFAVVASPAQAQEPTGASATKDCPNATPPDFYTIGDTVICTFTVENLGFFPGAVQTLEDVSPFPGGPATDITCTLGDGTVIAVGDDLPPAEPCSGTFPVTIPNDPALCNSLFGDRVEVSLLYDQFEEPLVAGAFATHVLVVVCRPDISVTKTASPFSKVGDPVTYTITVCNDGLVAVTQDSVDDSLLGDISGDFPETLQPGECSPDVTLTRMVEEDDPDPLVNTVTATYSAGIGDFAASDTATATATTNLFTPDVDVTKDCAPNPLEVGDVVTCTIVITNTSSDDTPDLINGMINDTLSGNLLDPANPAVADTTCSAVLPTGGSCTIITTRTISETDPHELENVVLARYNPDGFPNVVSDGARVRLTVQRHPEIFVTKTAPETAMVGDVLTYTIRICNVGPIAVNQDSVDDSLLGDVSGAFPETLVPDECAQADLTRTVEAGDPDPLENTVTATYSVFGDPTTDAATASTDLTDPT